MTVTSHTSSSFSSFVGGLGKRALGDWADVSSKSCLNFSSLFPPILTHTRAHIGPVFEWWKAGGPKWSERLRREREKVTEATERVWVRGESMRERGRMRRKGRIKQQAKWERKREGRNPPECFFAPTGQKVTAWRGRCQVMCDKSKLKMT